MRLTALPLWLSGFLVVVVPTVLAMAGTCVARRYVSLQRLRTNNEVAGFKFATVGVIYAVLLAFAVIVVWEKVAEAENDVAREAGATANLYRLIEGIDDGDLKPLLRNLVTVYIETAITDDWPAMAHGGIGPQTTRALNALYAAVLTYKPVDAREQALLAETLHELSELNEARRARLVKGSGVVPGLIWFVLFGGAILTVAFTFFFGTESLPAQTLMTGALTALIFSGLLVIIGVDHPFTGPVKVGPEALVGVLEEFSRGALSR